MAIRRASTGFWVGLGLPVVALLVVAAVAWGRGEGSSAQERGRGAMRPLSERLHVFARPQVSADRLPPAMASNARGLTDGAGEVEESLRPGALRLDRSRLLLANLGARKVSFYAFPTSKGKVCTVITAGPAGCEESLGTGSISWGEFDPDRLGAGVPIAVYGLADDDVARVEVVAGGQRHLADLGDNAFFYEPADPMAAAPEALVVTGANGTQTTISIPPPPPARQ